MKKQRKGAKKLLVLITVLTIIGLMIFEGLKSAIILVSILFSIKIISVKVRGYFWLDKFGNKLKFKEFLKRFGEGVEGITPLQQTKTVLISIIPVIAGLIWGATVTFLGKTYWMTLILVASLPITSIQFLSNWQKYKRQKVIEQHQKEAEKQFELMEVEDEQF